MSMTITETRDGGIKKIKAAWTSANTGLVSGTTSRFYSGRLIAAITVPDSNANLQPTDNYDITVSDKDSIDVCLGALANRDTANTEFVAEASLGAVVGSKLTMAIANAGDSKKATLYLLIK